MPFDQVAGLALSRRFALSSSFRPTYNMTANLVRRYEPDEAHRLLNRSFAQFQSNRSLVSLEGRRESRRELLERYRQDATLRAGLGRGVPGAAAVRRAGPPGELATAGRSTWRCSRSDPAT